MTHHASANFRKVHPKPREKGAAHSHVHHERRHKSMEGRYGVIGHGAVFTDTSFQSNDGGGDPTIYYPGVVLDDNGLTAYNAAGTTTMTISDADGSITIYGSGTITGAVIQTSASNPRTVMNSSGIQSYDNLGNQMFNLGGGQLTVSGQSVITGGTIQTSSASTSKVVLDATGIRAYDNLGNIRVNITTSGSFTLTNPQASITAATTGLTISSGAAPSSGARVTVDPTGIKGFNASNVQEFGLDSTTGLITASGIIYANPGSTLPWQTTGFFVGGGNLLSNASAEDPTSNVQLLFMDTGSTVTVNLLPGGTATLDQSNGNTAWTTTSAANFLNTGATQSMVTSPTPQSGSYSNRVVATATMAPPGGVAAVVGGTTGVWATTGLRYYKVTALNSNGETIGSTEVSANVTALTQTVTVSWSSVASATSYKVYRSTVSGGQSTSPALVGNPSTTSLVDTGTAATTGAVPATNTGVITNMGIAYPLAGTFLSGVAYTFSVYLRGNAGGELLQLQMGVTGTDSVGKNLTALSSTAWTRYTLTWTPSANRTTGVFIAIRPQTGNTGMTWFANAAQVEAAAVATAYSQGVFTLKYGTNPTSAAIEANATAAQIQTALNAAGVLPTGVTVGCSGGPLPGTPVTITFSSSAGLTPTALTVATQSLTGGNATAGVIPVGWSQYQSQAVIVNKNTGSAFHGGNVFQGSVSSAVPWFASQAVGPYGFIPGTSYTVSGYFKSPVVAMRPEFEIAFMDSNNQVIQLYTLTSTWSTNPTNWQRHYMTAQVPPANTRQTVTVTGGPTGGSLTLTFNGQTTAAIAWNATAAQVQSALQALSGVGAGGVPNVSGGPLPGTPISVSLIGGNVPANPPLMTATASLTGGASPGVVIGTLPTTYLNVYVAGTSGLPNVANLIYADAIQLEVADVPTAFAPKPDEILANTIQANMINVSQLSAISANLGTITAGTITGALIQTSTLPPNVVFDSSGIRAYNASGTNTLNIPSSGATSFFSGQITSQGLTIPAGTVQSPPVQPSRVSWQNSVAQVVGDAFSTYWNTGTANSAQTILSGYALLTSDQSLVSLQAVDDTGFVGSGLTVIQENRGASGRNMVQAFSQSSVARIIDSMGASRFMQIASSDEASFFGNIMGVNGLYNWTPAGATPSSLFANASSGGSPFLNPNSVGWDTASGSYIAPRTGLYLMLCQASWAASSEAAVTALSVGNRSTGYAVQGQKSTKATIGSDGMFVAGIITANAGEFLNAEIRQTTGMQIILTGDLTDYATWLYVLQIS